MKNSSQYIIDNYRCNYFGYSAQNTIIVTDVEKEGINAYVQITPPSQLQQQEQQQQG
jgi:hypothetical protein